MWLSSLELAIDTVDAESIRPFWAAVLGYDTTDDGCLVDPARRHAAIWLQQMDPPRTGRNRIHRDLTLPHDVARVWLAAALPAGGRAPGRERMWCSRGPRREAGWGRARRVLT